MDLHDKLNSEVSQKELADIRSSQLKQLPSLLEKEVESGKHISLYQLSFICCIIFEITDNGYYYFPEECVEVSNALVPFIEKADCSTDLDNRAKKTLLKVAKELKKTAHISRSLYKELYSIRMEYYHLT